MPIAFADFYSADPENWGRQVMLNVDEIASLTQLDDGVLIVTKGGAPHPVTQTMDETRAILDAVATFRRRAALIALLRPADRTLTRIGRTAISRLRAEAIEALSREQRRPPPPEPGPGPG